MTCGLDVALYRSGGIDPSKLRHRNNTIPQTHQYICISIHQRLAGQVFVTESLMWRKHVHRTPKDQCDSYYRKLMLKVYRRHLW